MSRRSIPEIRAAEARQAEMVRELAAELEERAKRSERPGSTPASPGGFAHFIDNLISPRAAQEKLAAWR